MTYVARSRLEELSENDCWRLLHEHQYGVGRVAFATQGAPHILPVNYMLETHDVIIRTGEGLVAKAATDGIPMSFEADSITQPSYGQRGHGWSVVVRGRAEIVDEAGQKTYLRLGHLAPAAGGFKPNYVRLIVEEISGRKV